MWQLTTDALLYTPEADSQVLIYQTASGDTHLLSALAGQVIQGLQSAPASTNALQQQCFACAHGQSPAEFQQTLAAILTELQQLDLITDTAA